MKLHFQVLLFIILGSNPSFAALGETKTNTAISAKVQLHEGFAVQESDDGADLHIREFIDSDRKVFGVAWDGQRLPDLSQLLGTHFAEFERASASQVRRRGPLSIQSGNLVAFSGKIQRRFIGHAYLENLIPAQVSKDSIK